MGFFSSATQACIPVLRQASLKALFQGPLQKTQLLTSSGLKNQGGSSWEEQDSRGQLPLLDRLGLAHCCGRCSLSLCSRGWPHSQAALGFVSFPSRVCENDTKPILPMSPAEARVFPFPVSNLQTCPLDVTSRMDLMTIPE